MYLDEIVKKWKFNVKRMSQLLRCCHKTAKERNELLRSAFMARIGSQYTSNQLIFLDKSSKDERTIFRGYGYSELNTRVFKK
ncbi:44986_t:CDS:2 [Gigaspora margarita]|uniref:44986_t:CDS:1 n=1 Tax=Gigaspora margarita TaxID=4874 RepID=A0ABM8W6U2_GIGMA|nr:44986_t:CDS:2 [Gigaspora margarita]